MSSRERRRRRQDRCPGLLGGKQAGSGWEPAPRSTSRCRDARFRRLQAELLRSAAAPAVGSAHAGPHQGVGCAPRSAVPVRPVISKARGSWQRRHQTPRAPGRKLRDVPEVPEGASLAVRSRRLRGRGKRCEAHREPRAVFQTPALKGSSPPVAKGAERKGDELPRGASGVGPSARRRIRAGPE